MLYSLDPPMVTLRLGSTLSPDDIKEGDDVYFECQVHSNPQWRKLLWLHNVSKKYSNQIRLKSVLKSLKQNDHHLLNVTGYFFLWPKNDY